MYDIYVIIIDAIIFFLHQSSSNPVIEICEHMLYASVDWRCLCKNRFLFQSINIFNSLKGN